MADARLEVPACKIDLASTPEFEIGGLRVRPARRLVSRGAEFERELEPRVMQVLVALTSARSEVVSRDRLIDTCWNGRIVGDDAINRCIVALRHLAKELSPAPFVIETVPRVGYSLVERGPHPGEIAVSAPANAPAASRPGLRRGASDLHVRRPISARWGAALLLAALLIGGLLLASRAWLASPQPVAPSLAVLPFRNLSSVNGYFGEGVAEEIRGQLSREPHFRVAGRSSSSMFSDAGDLREAGRKLRVNYLLEGSVRNEGDRVRVNVALVQASDGMRLWSDSYDGRLDEIFEIQQRIGSSIAAALRTKLVNPVARSGPLVTRGDVYTLYLTARGLLRTRNQANAAAAEDILRQTLRLDPGYAPAWASLAAAVRLGASESAANFAAKQQEAARYARHALRLAPDLAEAHGTLGMILNFSSPEAEAHIHRAAELDPSSGEIMMWLGHVHGNAGEFERQLGSYRRAVEIEPLLPTARASAAELAVQLGGGEAETYLRGIGSMNPDWPDMLRGFIAYTAGDFSEAVRRWAAVGPHSDPSFTSYRLQKAGVTLRMLGLPDRGWAAAGVEDDRIRFFMDRAPAPELWRALNRQEAIAAIHQDRNGYAAKLMLNEGRHRELLDTYYGPSGLLGLRPGRSVRFVHTAEAPLVALALRANGRVREASRLLVEADAAVARALRQPRVPFWLHERAAAIWSVQGRHDDALAALERAVESGSVHAERTDLPDIAQEPAFAALRGHPRFERVRARIRAHMARERRETAELRL